jgi:PST family polysaccharide transporter
MRYITILNIIVKVIFLILILVSIKSPEDILYYPILLTFGYIGILPFAFYLIHKNFGISFFIPDVKKLLYYFRYSSHFFISRVAMQFYTNGGLFVVGLISPELVVGYYAIADKLRYAITALYDPIAQVLYPYIAKAKNIMLYKKLFVIINLLNIMGLAILYFFTKDIMIFIFGECAQMTVTILHIFILVMILDIPSILFGYPLLGALGYTHFANYSLVVAAVVFIVALAILYALGMLTAQSVAWLYVFSIVIELSLRIWAIRKYKLLVAS